MKTLVDLETELLDANRLYWNLWQSGDKEGVFAQLVVIRELDKELLSLIGNARVAYQFSRACNGLALAESKIKYFKR